MSTNSSGSIRKALERARGRAAEHVDRWKKLLDDNPIPWDTTTTIEMIAKMEIMKEDIRKINYLWEKWELLVDSIDEAEAHTLDKDLYNEWRDKPEYEELMDDLRRCISKINSASSLKITSTPLDNNQHSDDNRVSTTSKRSCEDASPTSTPPPTSALSTNTPTTTTITVPPTTALKPPKRAKSPKNASPSASKPVVSASPSAATDTREHVESKFTKSPIKKPRTTRPIQITLGIRGDDLAPGVVKESSSTPTALTHANNNGSTSHPFAPKEPLSPRRETKTAQEPSGSTPSQGSSTSPATEKATTPDDDTKFYPCAPDMSSSAAGWECLSEKYYHNLLRERTSIDHKDARNALHHTNAISPCTIPYISHSHLSVVHEANCM